MELSASSISESRTATHYDWIDTLRGFAAVLIVLFHCRVDLWVGWNYIHAHPGEVSPVSYYLSYLSIPMPFMGQSVMLFFLISGFCVHLPNIHRDQLPLKSYLIRRFLRIYPPYLIAILLCLLLDKLMNRADHQTPMIVYLKSVFMIQNSVPPLGEISSNPSLWSLPVEMQLYLLYPLLFWCNNRKGPGLVALLVGAVTLLSVCIGIIIPSTESWVSANWCSYWLIWCGGAWLAENLTHPSLRWTQGKSFCFFLLLVGGVLSYHRLSMLLLHLLWAILFAFVLLYCAQRPLENRITVALRKIGVYSYSLYLIHYPVLGLMGALWVVFFAAKPTNLLIPLIASLLIFPLSWLFYRLFEEPFHRLARVLGKRTSI